MENISITLYKDGATQFDYEHKFKLERNHEKLMNYEVPDGSIEHIKGLTLEQVNTLALVFLDGADDYPYSEIC